MDNGPYDMKGEAFLLFQDGRHEESYTLCRNIMTSDEDPSIMILCAANLFHMGRLDESEAYFKDLVCRMPDSSYVHSYLGKVLEKKGDEQAIAEYARAVILDPENQEALRSYGAYLLSSGDPRSAIAVLRRLFTMSGREDDTRALIQALLDSGEPKEALEIYEKSRGKGISDIEYIRILTACEEFKEVSLIAGEAFEKTNNPAFARRYLFAMSRLYPDTALSQYPLYIRNTGDMELALDHIMLLKEKGMFKDAISACISLRKDIESPPDPLFFLMECELLAMAGESENALNHYISLVNSLLASMSDPNLLAETLASMRTFLLTYYPHRKAAPIFMDLLSGQANVVCLLAQARFYEETGDISEARSWYYRAYRSDYLEGGCEYAKFLSAQKDMRECEKVMIYILNNVRKTSDIVRVAGLIIDRDYRLYTLKRLKDRLIQRLESRISMLNSQGKEYLAISLLLAASDALEENDFPACKEHCLRGLDIIPPHSHGLHPGDFMSLIETCKERTLYDLPVFHSAGRRSEEAILPSETLHAILELDENEKKILEFLKAHRRANEMDLRTLLGTRRAAGFVNRIIRKSASKGVQIIEKKGVGQYGEIYEYCGI